MIISVIHKRPDLHFTGSTTLLLATNNITDMATLPTNMTEASLCIFNGVQRDVKEDCKYGLLKDYGVYIFSLNYKVLEVMFYHV